MSSLTACLNFIRLFWSLTDGGKLFQSLHPLYAKVFMPKPLTLGIAKQPLLLNLVLYVWTESAEVKCSFKYSGAFLCLTLYTWLRVIESTLFWTGNQFRHFKWLTSKWDLESRLRTNLMHLFCNICSLSLNFFEILWNQKQHA